jgi:hypothetical protein
MNTTTDLKDFGRRELAMASELLAAYKTSKDNTEHFYDDGVTVMMNLNSGNVFLTNDNGEVAMLNEEYLEDWYDCPVCGHEGFLKDMGHGEDDKECQEYLSDIGYEYEEETK